MTTLPATNHFQKTHVLGLGIQSFRYESARQFPEHTHAESSIVICTAGILESIQFSAVIHLRAGEVLITNRNTLHSSRYCIDNGPTEGLTIDLDHASAERLSGLERNLAPIHLSTTRLLGAVAIPRVYTLALDLKQELAADRPGKQIVVDCLATQICIEVLRSWPADMVRQHDGDARTTLLERWQFIRTIEFMYARSARKVDWTMLASSLGRDVGALQDDFRSTTSLSLADCHEMLLAKRALDLMTEKGWSSARTALQLGFNDGRQLARLMRRRLPKTPA